MNLKEDLIYYPVSRRKWKERQIGGYYHPESDELEEGGIRCFTGRQVEDGVNEQFAGRKTIQLMVIHTGRLEGRLSIREIGGQQALFVEERINLDAVIDKIPLEPADNGKFEIWVEER